MEFTTAEFSVIGAAEGLAVESQTTELSDVQLSLIGGGNLILGFN
jgi:hypothetical protein